MSRRTAAPVRHILPDPKFNNDMLAKFMNVVMKSGKKSAAERILYGAIDRIVEKSGKPANDAVAMLSTALDNVKPVVEVKSRRVGGATYQVPVEVRAQRRQTLAMRWLIEAARSFTPRQRARWMDGSVRAGHPNSRPDRHHTDAGYGRPMRRTV
jgi:small subunit ribosomal protein S7